jgi:hypothetical protein
VSIFKAIIILNFLKILFYFGECPRKGEKYHLRWAAGGEKEGEWEKER